MEEFYEVNQIILDGVTGEKIPITISYYNARSYITMFQLECFFKLFHKSFYFLINPNLLLLSCQPILIESLSNFLTLIHKSYIDFPIKTIHMLTGIFITIKPKHNVYKNTLITAR